MIAPPMRGKGILLFCLLLFLYVDSCSQKAAVEEVAGACLRPDSSEHLALGCQEALDLIAYIADVHLREEMDTSRRLKTAIQKILSKERIPTPYFVENKDPEGQPKYVARYVHFPLMADELNAVGQWRDPFDYREELCPVVERLSDRIYDQISSDDKTINRDSVQSLLYKGILRYFVAGLDPHSQMVEYLEYKYLSEFGSRLFDRDEDENVVFYAHSKKNPYFKYVQHHETSLKSEWLAADSAVVKIEILNFNADIAHDFKEEFLRYDRQKKIEGLLIDLRRNRGGEAFVVSDLADLFIREGILLNMREKTREGWKPHVKYARAGNELPGIDEMPVVILISRYSASSAETFSAALQDHKRAIIIGESSFGKGTGQRNTQLRDLPIQSPSCSVLSLTQFYTYTPKGEPLQNRGVVPDIELTDSEYYADLTAIDRHTWKRHHEKSLFGHALDCPQTLAIPFREPDLSIQHRWLNLKEKFEKHLGRFFSRHSLTSVFAVFSRS